MPVRCCKSYEKHEKTMAIRAAEIGLDIRANSRIRIFYSKGKRVSSDVYYHEKVSEILEEHPELTVK